MDGRRPRDRATGAFHRCRRFAIGTSLAVMAVALANCGSDDSTRTPAADPGPSTAATSTDVAAEGPGPMDSSPGPTSPTASVVASPPAFDASYCDGALVFTKQFAAYLNDLEVLIEDPAQLQRRYDELYSTMSNLASVSPAELTIAWELTLASYSAFRDELDAVDWDYTALSSEAYMVLDFVDAQGEDLSERVFDHHAEVCGIDGDQYLDDPDQ